MAKELNEDTGFQVSIKSLIAIGFAMATIIGMWFALQADIAEAKELPAPPSPEVTRMEFDMKDQALLPVIERALSDNTAYGAQYSVKYCLESEIDEKTFLRVDAERLMQVMSNFLSNAAKFSPSGATVSVNITLRHQNLRIAVSDTGKGIPISFRDKIFERFAQADSSDQRRIGGTGLGLAISKAMIENMGGSIGFDTELEIGTTFYVDFPLSNTGQLSQKTGTDY